MAISLAAQARNVDGPHTVAALLRAAGATDGDVFVYDYDPVVYALARVRLPTRYVLPAELAEFSESARVDSVTELTRVMSTRPRFVVVRARSPDEHTAEVLDDIVAQDLAGYRELSRNTYGDDPRAVTIYQR